MSAFAITPVLSLSSVAKRAVAVSGQVFARIAAVVAAAGALEQQRQPSEADLRGLGMAGLRFKHL